ncbi:urea amidolyase family protein [Microbacterium sp. BWT-B31]|uniref:5-oxoprolinase subunit B/C family protein n=1 Tax=Microbacterium sp. BWT-B31 TaxID=3232072 RepID=UPI003528F9A6
MTAAPRILPMGDRAVLVEVGALEEVLALARRLEASRPEGVIDLVPAARTVLVRVDPAVLSLASARSWVRGDRADAAPAAPAPRDVVDLDVVYDGADLAGAAALLGISPEALVHRHTSAQWTVAFTGFAPGFGYLVSPDWPFDVPRLESPRTRVPAGSVGLAGAFSGAYPRETPGGWRLIGTTGAALWDPDADSPALLVPGMSVRFRAVRASPGVGDRPGSGRSGTVRPSGVSPSFGSTPSFGSSPGFGNTPGSGSTRGIRIVAPGLLATVQDRGREGAASVGVSRSGALDRTALGIANRLVGNARDAAGIEVTMGGFRAVAECDLWFAVAGAWGPLRLAGRAIDPYEAHAWYAGDELQLDWFAHGARAYLAVRGGVEAPLVLGSRSTDRLAGLGPEALRAGECLTVGAGAADAVPVVPPSPWGVPHDDEFEVELAPGPRADWFTDAARATLFDSVWTVTADADRVGIRLDGPVLERARGGELPSEGMVPGALQVPPSGRPTILLADGPVTGGYPVIAVVTDASLDLLAQARPGTRLRFRHARVSG